MNIFLNKRFTFTCAVAFDITYSAHDTKIFIAWCERESKTVIQVLLYFCAATFCS